MSRFWSDFVGQLSPYVPGEQPRGEQLIKLNTNESPYDPSPQVMAAIASVSATQLRRYPDPESRELKDAFAARHGLEPGQVFLGNGSDEVLAHTFHALLQHDQPLCFPDICYSFYPVWCELYSVNFQSIPLTADFTVDPSLFPRKNGGIILPNPNAPTGIALELSGIRALLEVNPDSVVVVDEAYIDFGGKSAIPLIEHYDNLLVIQTLSKSRALAGLRVGVAMGSPALIDGLERVKNSFNSYPLDVLAQKAALAALADENWFEQCRDRVVQSREHLSHGLTKLGFRVLPSSTNFVMAHHPSYAARALFEGLREKGIIVRYFDKPRIDQFLRISVGTEQECAAVLSALASMVDGADG